MSYKLPKILSFSSSILSTILVAIFLINDYSNISISSLTKDEKVYTGLLLYSEINLGLSMVYLILSCFWSGMILCCNDKDTTTNNFSISKMIFILSGVASNFCLFFILIHNKIIIDSLLTASGWILIGNMLFIILTTVLYKIYKLNNKKYEDLN